MNDDKKGDSPKLDYYSDGGWGMKVDPNDTLTPEEAIQLAKTIERQHKGEPND